MKKLTKQQLLQQQTHSPAPPGTTSTTQGPPSKKKSKTASNSFTPHTKSAANSEMHIPLQRYSIGTNETPLAMNKNYEYFASTASGVAAQTAAQRQMGIGGGMHKMSNSQLPSNVYTSEHSNQHPTGIAAASVKNSNKISTLKNKAAFEKYHPSQQLAISNQHSGMNVLSTKEGSMTQHNSMSKANYSHQSSAATMQTSQQNSMSIMPSGVQHNTAVMSKLNHYQKMSSGPQKRTYVRGSSKKNQHHDHGITSTHVMPAKMHISSNHIDDKVKKSSSQSLIKIQAAQMIGSQAKEFSTAVKEEPRQTKQLKNMGHQTGSKKTFEGANPNSAAKDMSSSTSKKLIFSFKKESKQKVTPPNVQNNVAPSKPHLVGHHRRVQSHGQAIANFNLKTEQPSTKIHSPKVEKASHNDMVSSHQTSTIQGGQTDAASSGKGIPVTQQFLHHPALSKHYKQEYQLNKSKTSGGVSHSSLNASRDQVSILSLNSFSRSTPKFTQVLSLPQSVLNYQANMSRASNIPAKMLSPHSQTYVKQSINQVKSVAVKDKKVTAAGHAVPNEGTHGTIGVERGVKKIGKIQKHQKLRLKHTQSTVQPSNTGANMVQNNLARQCSPEVLGNNGRDATKTDHSQKAQALPTFDLKQMSSRNGATKSQGSIKEQASPFQPQSTQHSHYLSNTIQQMSLKDQNLDGTPKQLKIDTIKEGYQNNAQQQDTEAQQNNHGSHTYKVVAKHQKSQSYGQPVSQPGIYNMYMGQVNQLKKQRITLNKAGAANNTQPTHFINLNADQTGGLINQNGSLESLKKNSSHLQASSKIKMSVTGKAPNKLHLTTPPSAHDEKSQNDLNVMQESLSQDQDMNQQSFREALPNQPRANLVPQSLLQANGTAHQHHQSLKMTQNTINSNSNANIMSSKLQTTPNQQNSNSLQPTKSLTLKHKQLAKAIKQQHHAMIRQQDGVQQPPMTSKAMSTSTGPMLGIESELRSEKQLFINATISPKNFQRKIQNHSQTLQSPNQNNIVHPPPPHQKQTSQIQPKRMSHDNQIQPVEYLSERKRKTMGRMNHLDPLGIGERQKCWQSPGQGKSSISDKDASGLIPDPDFVHSSGVTNIMNQDGGQKSQQISAAIIKKIQNNYQVQVTNGYDSSMTTESAKALQSITQKIKNETTSVLPYLHALQEISEIYPNNNPLNTLLSQIHQGISTMILTKEDQIQQSQQDSKIMSKKLEGQEDLLQQAREQIQNLETNEEETRRHVHAMTQQIDDRDAKIEKLEQQILGHNKRARLMFKKQMASRAERPQLDLIFDGNCSELERQSDERRKVFQENEELQSAIDELNEDMAYGKQRENKLMFFLYILKQMGYPISEVFEREIKDVPTSRFSKNFDDEYKVMHAQLWKERREAKKEAKVIQQNGFGIDRDEILIESVPKTDRLIPMSVQNGFNERRYSDNRLPSGEIFDNDDDLNFYPLHVGPIQEQRRPDKVPTLNINKVLIIKHRRAKGLSVSNLINKTDSMDQQSESSDESLDSRGRPKRCPKPRLHKRILDQYGVQTGARNIMALESQVFKQKYQQLMCKSNTSELLADDELRYSLNSQRAESMQSQRI